MCVSKKVYKTVDEKGHLKQSNLISCRAQLCHSKLQMRKKKKCLVCFPIYMVGRHFFFQNREELRSKSLGRLLIISKIWAFLKMQLCCIEELGCFKLDFSLREPKLFKGCNAVVLYQSKYLFGILLFLLLLFFTRTIGPDMHVRSVH